MLGVHFMFSLIGSQDVWRVCKGSFCSLAGTGAVVVCAIEFPLSETLSIQVEAHSARN